MELTKKYLRSLLTANPTAMTVRQVSIDYQNTIGESIPYTKFGYTSLEQFLRSIPDTVQLQGTGPFALVNLVVSEKSSHIVALVSRQRVERRKGLRYPLMKRTVVPTPNVLKNYTPPVTRSQSQKIVYPTIKSSNSSTINTVSTSASNWKQTFKNKFTLSNNSIESDTKKQISPENSNGLMTESTIRYKPSNDDHNMEKITKMVDGMKISKATDGIQRWNQSHKSSSSDQMTDPDGDYTISRTSTRHKVNIAEDVDPSEECVPVAIRNNLKKLIAKYPDGIWCAELPAIYRKMFRRELKYHDSGFRSLIELCTCLKSIFHYVRPSADDFKLYDKNKPLPDTAETVFTIASYSNKSSLNNAPALPSIDWTDVLLFIPPDIFKPGQEIQRAFVPETTQEGDTIEIVVGEVFDVSKFWVYKDDGKLDKLMDNMQLFYGEHAESYKVPQHLIREGLYCVSIIFGEYHRVLVVNAMCEGTDEIRVFYIDYGTIKQEKPNLYFLHEKFAELPAQTIRCRLANICPPEKGAPWSRECTEEFKVLLKKRDLMAKINRINWEDKYLEVLLADVTDSENVFYINNVLVEKGYAIFAYQEPKISIVNSICTPIVNLIHLFPTFMELENGLAPSTSEMETYSSCNVPINFCYPQYFYFDHSEEEKIIEHVTNFYESRILKGLRSEIHRNFNVDVDKITEKPIDFSHFMELEGELRQFWENQNIGGGECEEVEENSSSVDIINDDLVTNISKKIEMWKTDTINELRGDCKLSEDIMEILDTGRLNSESVNLDCLKNNTDQSDYQGISVENIHFDDFRSISRSNSWHSSITNNTYPSFRTDSQQVSFEYPESSNENLETLKSDVKENDLFRNSHGSDKVGKLVLHPTNPFLTNVLEGEEIKQDIIGNNGRLHPNNPFLHHINKNNEEISDVRSDSSGSTSYKTNVEETKVDNAWSTKDDRYYYDGSFSSISTEELKPEDDKSTNPSNNSASPSSSSKSCSVQTNLGLDVNKPEFIPQDYFLTDRFQYTCYPPQHPTLYNPYYHQRSHFIMASSMIQSPAMSAPFSNRISICPPPGFSINSNVIMQGNMPDFYEAHNERLRGSFRS
ncbi:tudor domain-containing protein 5 [Diorhabda sublineata]|uniref:tudor domain-containing protein 5 n=1 Tax=Diorhabda sublineata TaxID=1163346 RepID=UPI0024E09213|nr:tudor domain-containing protein 5 [Diorhabda sublineata]